MAPKITNNIIESKNNILQLQMRNILRSLFGKPSAIKQLELCKNHPQSQTPQPIPYSKDTCITCNEDLCHVCSENHIIQFCDVNIRINKNLGQGILKTFNMGHLMKVDLRDLRCICGKKLTSSAAICAGCGLASCSEQCHALWQKEGMCTFKENFYSVPSNFTMRSIPFKNIEAIQKFEYNQWIVANKSGPSMISCYASSQHPYVYLQRGYRNYGNPSENLINIMEQTKDGLDYHLHLDRLCDCSCLNCQEKNVKVEMHPVSNCLSICYETEHQSLKQYDLVAENHKQCTCDCEYCKSGIITSTHRKIDCMLHCPHSYHYTQR